MYKSTKIWNLYLELLFAISTKTREIKDSKEPFGLREKGGRVERSKVEMDKNKLILGQIYSTLLYSLSFSLNPNGL